MIELPVTLTSTGGAVSFASPVPLGYTKNKGVYRLLVTAEGEWEGLTIRCFWHLPGGADPASSLVQDGAVDVPASVTAHPGNGCITFEGSDGVKTVTSADLRYRVGSNSGTEDGTMPEPGTPAWEQLVSETAVAVEAVQKQIGNLDDLTTKAKETLVAAINEAARTGSGGAGSITMRTDGGYIQYSTDDGSTWENLIALAELKGEPGENGADGAPGADGYSPTASVEQIADGAKITITDKSGTTEAVVKNGKDGENGRDGVDGQPGKDGTDGITPTIGANGNWYLGGTDTGKPSRGADGATGATGATGEKGTDGKSAYAYAVEGGYTGTEAEFAAKLAQEKFANPNALTFTGAVTGSYDGSEPLSVEIPSGGGGSAYELPVASATQLGGVMPEAKTDAMHQPVGVDANGRLYAPAAALPTDDQVSTAVDAYLTANGVKCNDVWVDAGTITVAEGEAPTQLVWNLDGAIKKYYIEGTTIGHSGSGNLKFVVRSGTGTVCKIVQIITGNWTAGTTSTIYVKAEAEEKANGKFWYGLADSTTLAGTPKNLSVGEENIGTNVKVLSIGAYWNNQALPVGTSFNLKVVYK